MLCRHPASEDLSIGLTNEAWGHRVLMTVLGDVFACSVTLSAFHLLWSRTLERLCWEWREGADRLAEGLLPWQEDTSFILCLGTVLSCWQESLPLHSSVFPVSTMTLASSSGTWLGL